MKGTGWLTDERREIIAKVLSDHKGQWYSAFERHPEWRQQLDFDGRIGKKNSYNTLSRFRIKGPDWVRSKSPGPGRPPGPAKASPVWAERDEIVRQLIQAYNVDYERAFTEHPEWRLALRYDDPVMKGRLYARVSYWRRRLREEKTPAPAAVAAAAAAAPAPTNESALIEQIVDGYSEDGKTKWSLAMFEHPDWAQALDYGNLNKRQILYRLASGLVRKRAMAQMNGAPDAPAALADPISFCPKCGFNLLVLRTAFTVALKHSLKQ